MKLKEQTKTFMMIESNPLCSMFYTKIFQRCMFDVPLDYSEPPDGDVLIRPTAHEESHKNILHHEIIPTEQATHTKPV